MDEAREREEGEKLVEVMENLGFTLLNGRSNSEKDGELTFVGQGGTSLIDLVWVTTAALFTTTDMKVLIMGMSDHLPVKVTLNNYFTFSEQAERIEVTCLKWNDSCKIDFQNKLAQIELPSSGDTSADYETLQDSVKLVAKELDLLKNIRIDNKTQYRANHGSIKRART